MRFLAVALILAPFLLHVCSGSQCTMANWWGAFDHQGWVYCDGANEYITGLWRNDNEGSDDEIILLEEARCCKAPTPLENQRAVCQIANWWGALDNENSWALCPTGYFMRGMFRNDCDWLYCIEEAQCCKPEILPDVHVDCYDENVWGSFDNKGLSKCKDGYYMTGIFRSDCDKLYCIEYFKCCKMFTDEFNPKNGR